MVLPTSWRCWDKVVQAWKWRQINTTAPSCSYGIKYPQITTIEKKTSQKLNLLVYWNTQNILWVNLKLDHLSLTFFVTSQLEMLRTFDGNLETPLALSAFQTQHQFLGSFGLKVFKISLKSNFSESKNHENIHIWKIKIPQLLYRNHLNFPPLKSTKTFELR